MSTTVVDLRKEPYDEYIGRGNGRAKLRQSSYRNPFRPADFHSENPNDYGASGYGARMMAVAAFEEWVTNSDEPRAIWIREHVHELKGKRLGCWCAPLPCHGDVLARMADGVGS